MDLVVAIPAKAGIQKMMTLEASLYPRRMNRGIFSPAKLLPI